MKIRIFFFLSAFLLFFGVFFSFKWIPVFDFTIEKTPLLANRYGEYFLQNSSPKNTFYIGIDKNVAEKYLEKNTQICAQFFVKKKIYEECLDDKNFDNTDQWYTFPVITDPTEKVHFVVFSQKSGDQKRAILEKSLTAYAINTRPSGKKLALNMHFFEKTEADARVISRREWGADESIRYKDNPRQQKIYQDAVKNFLHPKTEAAIKNEQFLKDANDFVEKENQQKYQTVSLIRTENWHELVWPIHRVNFVDKVVIHHTADSIQEDRSDEEVIRAIYAFHAITRGWGDIGYNFLIGQTGKIYEGRAGGDYVVGAHAAYNNVGSVGISVLGDYQKNEMSPKQKAWLEAAIEMVGAKYGIDFNKNVTGYRACKNWSCYPMQKLSVNALMGHKDVGTTNCPGVHIYKFLPSWRANFTKNTAPVYNGGFSYIEPKNSILSVISQENNPPIANMLPPKKSLPIPEKSEFTTAAPKNSLQTFAPKIDDEQLKNTRYFWEKFRVKLSYPDTDGSITLRSLTEDRAFAFLDYRRKPIYEGSEMTVSPLGKDSLLVKFHTFSYEVKHFAFSAPVVQISSWNRRPDWDKTGTINDNAFRDTIEIYNENGKMVVVNHLPLEWYLKGLGEVSNGDLPEKIKTIMVAARSYAEFYAKRENRKYNTHRYDGSDDPDSFQKYIGYNYEKRSPNVAKMVDATRGEMIYYQNTLIKPWYFSVSDGRTLSYAEYCALRKKENCENIVYLVSVPDPAGIGKTRSGHGVGISGIGATDFAKKWWNYKHIIQYYLPGVEVKK